MKKKVMRSMGRFVVLGVFTAAVGSGFSHVLVSAGITLAGISFIVAMISTFKRVPYPSEIWAPGILGGMVGFYGCVFTGRPDLVEYVLVVVAACWALAYELKQIEDCYPQRG